MAKINLNEGEVSERIKDTQHHESHGRVYSAGKGTQRSDERIFLMNPADLARERGMVAPGSPSLSRTLFQMSSD
jgi:hypothetical protein